MPTQVVYIAQGHICTTCVKLGAGKDATSFYPRLSEGQQYLLPFHLGLLQHSLYSYGSLELSLSRSKSGNGTVRSAALSARIAQEPDCQWSLCRGHHKLAVRDQDALRGDTLWKMTTQTLHKDNKGQTTSLVNRKADSEEDRHTSTIRKGLQNKHL